MASTEESTGLSLPSFEDIVDQIDPGLNDDDRPFSEEQLYSIAEALGAMYFEKCFAMHTKAGATNKGLSKLPRPSDPEGLSKRYKVSTDQGAYESESEASEAPQAAPMDPASSEEPGVHVHSHAQDETLLYSEPALSPPTPEVKPCFLHKKFKSGCSKCEAARKAAESLERRFEGVEARWKKPRVMVEEGLNMEEKVEMLPAEVLKGRFGMAPLLATNILMSEVFKSELLPLSSASSLASFLEEKVDLSAPDVGPYASGTRQPSLFFGGLYRLMQIHPANREVEELLSSSSFVSQCLALLYLRFVHPPSKLILNFFGKILENEDEKAPEGFEKVFEELKVSTKSQFAVFLLKNNVYLGTPLTKMEVKDEKKIAKQLKKYL